ncbi:MAG: hypothetical protein Q9218_007925, partial [Villophora microphyllina]
HYFRSTRVAFFATYQVVTYPSLITQILDNMHVPLEILFEVFQHLDKNDLKSIRLCCKTYSYHASRYLFDTVYVSPYQLDYDVLVNVTNHPVLSTCVKHLRYDAGQFPQHLASKSYIGRLITQCQQWLSWGWILPESVQDLEAKEFLTMAANSASKELRETSLEIFRECKHYTFIRDGILKFKEYADRQRHMAGNIPYWNNVAREITRCPNMESAILDARWSEARSSEDSPCGKPLLKGSPVSRAWNVLHLRPFKLRGANGPEDDPLIYDGSLDFIQLCLIAAHFPRALRRLETKGESSALSTMLFSSEKGLGDILRLENLVIFSKLQTVDIGFDHVDEVVDEDPSFVPLLGLQRFLHAMPRLQELRLSLPSYNGEGGAKNKRYTIEQVFPLIPTYWNNMRCLDIDHLAFNPGSLVSLLMFEMPNLRVLRVAGIELLSGTWEHILVLLACRGLTEFYISPGFGLFYPNNNMVWDKETPVMHVDDIESNTNKHREFMESLENFVVHPETYPAIGRTLIPDLDTGRDDINKITESAREVFRAKAERALTKLRDLGYGREVISTDSLAECRAILGIV